MMTPHLLCSFMPVPTQSTLYTFVGHGYIFDWFDMDIFDWVESF